MTELTAALDDLAPEPGVRTLVEAVAAKRSVAAERVAAYVSLRPGIGGPIAAFVHRAYIDVAQPPPVAPIKAAEIPGATLIEKTPATTYVHVPLAAVGLPGVLTMVQEALQWRSTMPDTTGVDASRRISTSSQPCSVCGLAHAGEC